MPQEETCHTPTLDISVLCVEDERVILAYLQKILAPHVREVFTANNGSEGILAFSKHRPDVVLSDIRMPKMDGVELARGIRTINRETPIIFTSAHEDTEFFCEAIDLRIFAYLIKPLEEVLLVQTLSRCAENIHRNKELAEQKLLNEVMLESLPNPAMLLHKDTRAVVSLNKSARDLGFSRGKECSGPFCEETPFKALRQLSPFDLFPKTDWSSSISSVQAFDRVWDLSYNLVFKDLVLLSATDITHRQQMERSIQESERKYRLLAENSMDVIFTVNDEYRFTYISPSVERMLGYSVDEAISQGWDRFVSPDSISVVEEFIRDRYELKPGEDFSSLARRMELRLLRKGGKTIWTELLTTPLCDDQGLLTGFLGLCRDISERKSAEKALIREKEFISAILQNSSDGIAVAGSGGELKFISPGMERLFGYPAEDITTVGTLAGLIFTDQEAAQRFLTDWRMDMARDNPPERIYHIRHSSGEGRWCRLQLSGMPGGDVIISGQDISEIKQAEERILHLALHDTLTDLPNRQLLQDRLEQSIARAKRQSSGMAVLYVDLDHFKEVNDTYGHKCGDKVLMEIAKRFAGILRESDTVARLGGDEFVVVLPDLARPEAASIIADKVIKTLTEPLAEPCCDLGLGASVGISIYPQDGPDSDTLITSADRAMYQAKRNGGNTYCFVKDLDE